MIASVSYVHHVHTGACGDKKGIRSTETGVTGGCVSPCTFSELNQGPLQEQEQYVLLDDDPSLLPLQYFIFMNIVFIFISMKGG